MRLRSPFGGLALLALGALGLPAPAAAQGIGVDAGWYYGDPKAYFVLSAGSTRRLSSPLAFTLAGSWYSPLSGSGGDLLGLGVDLSLWRGGSPGLYVVGGVSGGFGFSGADVLWGSYSIGAGYEFRLFSNLGLAAEARWRGLTQGGDEGVQVGVRLGFGMHRKGSGAPAAPPPASAPAGTTGTGAVGVGADSASAAPASAAAQAVVQTALDVMGTPYRWGGTSADGFDCSGLIQYAYSAHGIMLPRTSADQARQGTQVDRSVPALVPGDILTFSAGAGGSQVNHVGLYIGGGEFIHSATNGVQKSRLSATDPYGKWWWERWVGARRLLPG
jgi:cell wall-associated NlpC family hydrolase